MKALKRLFTWRKMRKAQRNGSFHIIDMSHVTTACSHDIDLLGQKERPLKREAAH